MIRVRLPPAAIEHVAIAYSPLVECVLSLRVLLQPKRHPLHQRWARAMRRLPSDLQESITAHAFIFHNNAPVFLAAHPGGFEPLATELELLCAMPPSTIRFQFTWGLHAGQLTESDLENPETRHELLRIATDSLPHHRQGIATALEHPERFIADFVALVDRYYRRAFVREWGQIEPLLAESTAQAGELLAARGLYNTLPLLSPRLRGDERRRQILIEKWIDGTWTLNPQEDFVLGPSVYAWPNLLVGLDDGPWPKGIIYPAPFLSRRTDTPTTAPELLPLLRALADRTRLQVLQLLAERPTTTQDLAPRLGISEAALSKHLRLLHETGVLRRERQGKYVLYSLQTQQLEQLQVSLLQYLTAHRPADP